MKTPKARVKKFFWWINERHAIYIKRQKGEPWPWTRDPILQKYKFTNVFRQLDAETLAFNERMAKVKGSRAEKLYHMIAFRAFNRHQTYDRLLRVKDGLHNPRKMKKILHREADRGMQIFTGAYIITNAGQNASKIDLMADALAVQYRARHRIWEHMQKDGTMEGCTRILRAYPMQGPFTAYEVICDMRYQEGMLDKAPDRKTWANLGPGARRGINRIVSGKKKPNVFRTTEEYVEFMVELLKTSPQFRAKHVPPMEMREIEHSLCEFDKWCRVYNNEGRPRAIYRRPE
jgi:hypothetical protein